MRISYREGSRRRYFACRQITRLDPDTGHQTHTVTTRGDAAGVKAARAELDEIEADLPKVLSDELTDARTDAASHVKALGDDVRAVPARVPLAEVHPDAVVHHGERKRLHDAIRMATYNAGTALARLLRSHYARAEDEARCLLREAMHNPADLQIVGDELHVRINALSAPRRSRAIAGLCADLTPPTPSTPAPSSSCATASSSPEPLTDYHAQVRSPGIVVLDGGWVVEEGTHDELQATHGRYAELYALQAGAYK